MKNGFLNEKIVYDVDGNVVHKTKSMPALHSPQTFWSFKTGEIAQNSALTGHICDQPVTYAFLYFTPVQIGKVVTTYTIETTFEQNVPTVVARKDFSYNAIGLLKKEETTGSDGKINCTEYRYANDYIDVPWVNDLVAQNMVELPLETLNKVNNLVVGGGLVKYKSTNGMVTPNEIYSVETAIPKSIPSTTPSGVIHPDFKLKGTVEINEAGNIKLRRAPDNVTTSYLWSYSNLFPVAVVTNAEPTEIYFDSFEEATAGTTTEAKTGTKGFGGVYTVPLPVAGPGHYNLSYWRKSGGEWEFVVDVMSSSSKTIGAVGVMIDDVRVHPVDATMTTFTYDPTVGMTSSTDANGHVTTYEYDEFSRLKLIRDDAGNIVKHLTYHYKD